MSNYSIKDGSLHAAGLAACLCFAVGLANPATGQSVNCKTSRVTIPHTANLPDGDQEIAAAETALGRLAARVRVKDKVVSDRTFILRGQPLRPASESGHQKEILACLNQEKGKIASRGQTHRKKKKGSTVWYPLATCDDLIRTCFAIACVDGTCAAAEVKY